MFQHKSFCLCWCLSIMLKKCKILRIYYVQKYMSIKKKHRAVYMDWNICSLVEENREKFTSTLHIQLIRLKWIVTKQSKLWMLQLSETSNFKVKSADNIALQFKMCVSSHRGSWNRPLAQKYKWANWWNEPEKSLIFLSK